MTLSIFLPCLYTVKCLSGNTCMDSFSNIPWNFIHDFLVDVGNIRDPKEFCVQLIKSVYSLIPYDQARIYFINDLGKIDDEVLVGVEKQWSDAYLQYYSQFESGRYSIPIRGYQNQTTGGEGRYSLPRLYGGIYDWTKYQEKNEFITEYIKPQGLKYTAGFGLHSTNTFVKSVYILDRTSRSGYSQQEINIMRIIQPHLDNLHQNLFVLAQSESPVTNSSIKEMLTKRELEIGDLLTRGLAPNIISRHLSISVSTIYRHIANMHKKLDVCNRQELILKLMKP